MLIFGRRSASLFLASVLAPFSLLASLHASAQESETFPSRPITLLVCFPAGGPADVLARALQPTMAKALKQPLIIENLPGAGGALAMQRLIQKPADGYTLIIGSPNEAILAPLAIAAAHFKAEDLVMLAPISNIPLVVMARKDLPFNSLDDIVAAARKPGAQELSFGNPGHGSMYHILSEYFAQTTGAKVMQVPYKGATPLMQDLAGQQIDLTIAPNVGVSAQLIETGKVKAINVLDAQRIAGLPGVQAISESSIAQKKELMGSIWASVMVRAGVPAERMKTLLDAVQLAIASPELAKVLASSGTVPTPPQSLAASARFYNDETVKFKKMAASIKLTPQ
ncbi:tripartite tricarboxylate transporter substrate binding protein [Variovorax paradoxus]|uniref:tripartite tricarboxylate transporter substrate binding protein n=1 Tax=Variovorax paradoxus TaxID=34073 RepID=UPI0005AC0970|nr:tripartite tricarboxylate transporter substrate binding protein [Variovorax paradoxus]